MTELPPTTHCIEAEQMLLGSVLVNNEVWDRVSGIVSSEHFFEGIHAKVWAECGRLIDAGRMASPITLKSFAATLDGMDQLGGPSYLVNCAGAATPTIARDLALQVRETFALRSTYALACDVQDKVARPDSGGLAGILSQVETEVALLQRQGGLRAASRSWGSAMTATVEDVVRTQKGEALGVSTGFARIDEVTGGLRPGNSFVVAGRPGMGKTALAVQIALNLALRGDGVLYVSLEMPAQELASRAITSALRAGGASLAYQSILHGTLDAEQARMVAETAHAQQGLPLEVGEIGMNSTTALASTVRRLKRAWKDRLKLVIVDHIGLMTAPGMKQRIDRVGEVSRVCKQVALENEVTVMPLSQLSRAVEARDNKRPMLSDLRDSGEVEQDADVVLFPYREAYYAEREAQASQHDPEAAARAQERADQYRHSMELIFAKVRSGRVGVRTVRADMGTNQIHDTNPGEDR